MPAPTATCASPSMPTSGRRWREGCAAGRHDLVALWADGGIDAAWRCSDPGSEACAPSSRSRTRGRRLSVGRRPSSRRRSGWSARCATSTACSRSVCPIRGPGSTTVAGRAAKSEARYEFLPAEGEGLHQIPVGPVHAGIIEPGHFRFTANGETVVRLEERLGYVHKGVEGLLRRRRHRAGARASSAASPATARSPMPGPSPARSRRRSDWTPPPRAVLLRGIMAELERLVAPHQRCRRDLQRRQRADDPCPLHPAARGHAGRGRRLLRPSPDDGPHRAGRRGRRSVDRRRRRGSAAFWRGSRRPAQRSCGSTIRCRRCRIARSPPASSRPSSSASSPPAASSAARPAAPSMRARPSPMRLTTSLIFDLKTRTTGDVDARLLVRMDEIVESLGDRAASCSTGWRRATLRSAAARPVAAGEGAALVEAFRGDVFVSVRLDDGRAARARACARRQLVPVAAAGGRRSRATSSPTSRSATSRSTAPTRGTICEGRGDEIVPARRPAQGHGHDRPARRRARPRSRKSRGRWASAPASGSAARWRSARSMPARATAANSRSTRSTIRSTTSSASA